MEKDKAVKKYRSTEKGRKNTYYTNTKSACKKFLLTMSTKEDFELAKTWVEEGEKRWKS